MAFNPGMRELTREQSDHRAQAGEPFVLRFRVPRDSRREIVVSDLVYGTVSKSPATSRISRCCARPACDLPHGLLR